MIYIRLFEAGSEAWMTYIRLFKPGTEVCLSKNLALEYKVNSEFTT